MTRLARTTRMVTLALVLGVFSSALPSAALAGQKTIAPPGNSGVSEYSEDLPTVQGQKPTGSIVVPPSNGSGGSSSGGTGTGSGTGSPGSSAIPRGVIRKLKHSGSSGQAAAALAQATAPTSAASIKAAKTPQAPATSVLSALTGTTGGGGLGALLPVLLFAALIILSAIGILKRRRAT